MEYHPSALFRHHHFSTIYPSLFRKVRGVNYQRERIDTPDEDFIDLDWSANDNQRLVVICHGLEGSSDSPYMRGMVKAFNFNHWDAVAYNYRACSGEMNRHLKAYHAGATYDLHTVLEHIVETKDYREIALIGFSLGGNLILKYFGEAPEQVHKTVTKAVAISAPVHLESCAKSISSPSNFIYNERFIRKLRKKSKAKKQQIIDAGMDYDILIKTKSLKEFDNQFTAPANGFEDAVDYWTQNSSKQFLKNIQKPTLLLNAQNDPFLAPPCFPYEEAKKNANFEFLAPKYGGHVGFAQFNKAGLYWDEEIALKFCGQ